VQQEIRKHEYQPGFESSQEYIPRGQNVLQTIFKDHFVEFKEIYDEKYAKTYGNYRIDRITEVVEEFFKCGDYKHGMARIKCTNPDCDHEYFIPLSCKGFYFCPSCHQKRTLLFSEQVTNEVLLRLPHRQWVWTLPKCLRIFFKHDRMLFSNISRLIFDMIQSYYNEATGKQITSAALIAYESSGDFLKFHPHWHSIILEGGFDEEGNFVYLPISDTRKITELFRRSVIKYFQEKELINEKFARNLLSWKHSGFSVDNSIRIYGNDDKTREALSQYIAKPPISLKKLKYEPFHGKVLYKTKEFNEYFKENFKFFDVFDFIAEATQHIPPRGKQYIRRYGLYSSRSRGIWSRLEYCCRLAPQGWKEKHLDSSDSEEIPVEAPEYTADEMKQKSAWARLIAKVYGEDPYSTKLSPNCNFNKVACVSSLSFKYENYGCHYRHCRNRKDFETSSENRPAASEL
jgi:hypothetical protein